MRLKGDRGILQDNSAITQEGVTMKLDWTTVIASGVPTAIVGGFQLFNNRYLTRILDTIERRLGIVPGDKKDKK